jgi:hypothetical protein
MRETGLKCISFSGVSLQNGHRLAELILAISLSDPESRLEC